MIATLTSIAGAFIGTSFVLNRWPLLIWKPLQHSSPLMQEAINERGRKILHISHRGGSFENFENSGEAFKHAVENTQTDVLETDVCLTKDGQVVCFHDNNMDRLCGVDKDTQEVDYSEIVYLRDIKTEFSIGDTYVTPASIKIIKPLLLQELFERFPNTHINLELKTKNSDLIPLVHNLITKYKRQNITQWGSFSDDFSKELTQYDPSQVRFLAYKEFLNYMTASVFGVLPFLPIQGQIFQIPFYTDAYKESSLLTAKQSPHPFLSALKVHIQFGIIKAFTPFLPSMNEHLNKRGILVFYWVLNSEHDFQKCIESNPNGIITDSPTLLKKFLAEKGRSFSKSK